MKTPVLKPEVSDEVLTRIERMIAQRADQLSQGINSPRIALACWMQAEREFWEKADGKLVGEPEDANASTRAA